MCTYQCEDMELSSTYISNLSNNIQNSSGLNAKRCLFGAPNVEEISNLLDADTAAGKDRILKRYGLDVDGIENMLKHNKDINAPYKKTQARVSRGVLKPYNKKIKITDLFKAKKNISTKKDKE